MQLFHNYFILLIPPSRLKARITENKKTYTFNMKVLSAVVSTMAIGSAMMLATTKTTDAFVPHRLLLQQQQQQQLRHDIHNNNKNKNSQISLLDDQRLRIYVPVEGPMGFLVRRFAALDDDDDEEDDEDDDDEDDIDTLEPLADGIDSVSWLPSVKDSKTSTTTSKSEEYPDAELIPLFPLGGIVYTPNSQHTLNIFEPRYREMYTDILMNGTKRFAVAMSHPTKSGTFAQMAVLFELEDLKEVSERTADQIKYICNHRVTGRVKLHRVLNPQDWETRSTYLRAEGTVIDDSGKSQALLEQIDNPSIESSTSSTSSIEVQDIENPIEQKLLKDAFGDLVEIQHELEEDVRFTRASVFTLAVKPGSKSDGLWQTIKLWSSFIEQRLMSRQNELQQDFQDKLQNYLKKEKGLKGELPRYGSICCTFYSTMFDVL